MDYFSISQVTYSLHLMDFKNMNLLYLWKKSILLHNNFFYSIGKLKFSFDRFIIVHFQIKTKISSMRKIENPQTKPKLTSLHSPNRIPKDSFHFTTTHKAWLIVPQLQNVPNQHYTIPEPYQIPLASVQHGSQIGYRCSTTEVTSRWWIT